jgi:hypothetical protein
MMESELQPVTVPTEEPDQPITVPSDTAPAMPLPPAVAKKRADKAYVGLGGNYTDIHNQIASGQEQELREGAASSLNHEASMKRERALVDAYSQKGSPLSYQEALRIVDPYNPDNTSAKPEDVIERAYSTKFVSSANTAAAYMQDTILDKARQEIPQEVQDKESVGGTLLTKFEVARTFKQNQEAEISGQGWPSWLADQAKTMLQPYNEYKMRGLNPAVGKITGGLLLGDNMKSQADEMFSRPVPQFIEGLKSVKEQLKDNPTLYGEFLDYILGQSDNDRKLQNIFTIISPADISSVAGASKALLRKISINNRTGVVFKQMVQASAKADADVPVKAVMEEAAGDVKSAGVTRAAENIAKTLDGSLDPIQDVKEKFTSNFRLDGDILDSKPGNLSTQELTILKDGFYKSGSGLYDTILNALKLNRTPVPLASEDALRAYQIEARKGLMDAQGLLDIGSPLKSAETNTYHVPFTFGDEEGRLFSDPETAVNNFKRRGYAEPRVVEAEGTVTREQGKLVGSVKDLRDKVRLENSIPVTEKFLQRAKDFTSKKFIGPRTAESIAKAKEEIESVTGILKGYKDQLAEIGKRVITSDPVIEQHGVGYKVVIIKPYKETDDTVRSWLINDKKSQSSASLTGFDAWKNSFLGWVRGADDTLAFNESLNRKIATYTQTLLRQWAKDDAEAIEKIANQFKWMKPRTWYGALSGGNKQMFKEWNETVKFAKTMDDPVNGGKGYFFKTPGDLDDHYQRYYQRSPTFPEVQAYFAHVKLVEGNRVLSEIAEFRNRARLGAEQHQVYTLAKDGTRVGSEYFDGIQENTFPGGLGQVMVVGERQGEERLYNLGANDIPGREIQKYRDWVETGKAKLIRIYDPDAHPLQAFSDTAGSNRIRYVLSVDADTKPLDLNHVNRRGGGHFDVDSDWYVKQANIVDETPGNVATDKRNLYKRIYTGDNTFMPIANRVMGKDVSEKMTQMNTLMRENRIEEAKALSAKLGINWDTMESWYKPKIHPVTKKQTAPFIDMNEPFYLVPRNRKIFDIDKTLETRIGIDRFQDGTKSGSDAQQFQVAYNQARDSDEMFTLKDAGTRNNPIYKYVPADYVDPIPTMNRALNRAINSTFMDDYKISAVEHWLQEALPYLKKSESEIRSAPFYHFNSITKGDFKSAADLDNPGVIDNLLSNRYKINQFVGMPNKVETTLHGLTQLLVDNFYRKFGPEEGRGPLARAFTVVPLWALAKTTNPVSAIRSFAFNAKLGIFSIPQFFVQAQTFTNIIALSPRAGMAGTYATMLHTWSRVNSNPEVLKALDEYASKLNMFGSKWKLGEWAEARQELAKTGFEHVGGEYQLADDQMTHKFIKNQWNNFLDAGQVFFKEGEKATRLGAYYTAFREFRDVNPTKVLTDVDRAEILNKADLLTNNMSRASASSLNHSLLSLPTQFLSYQVRMAELFFGKRIGETTLERTKARAMLVGMYSAMYGVPSAIGITGYPFGDSIREYAINKGYVIGDNQILDMAMNGIPAWQMSMITGKTYNVGDRYGSQGFTQFKESLRSDKTAWSVFGGAGASSIINTIASLDPFWQAAKYMVSDDEEGNAFKVTPMHFVNLFSEVAAADSAKRAFYAIHTGRWLSKNENYIEDVKPGDVIFRTITGLKSQDQDDIFSLKNIKDTEERVQKDAERDIVKDYHRAVQATADKDYDTAATYFANARARMIASGIPIDRRTEIYANASRGYEPQIETSKWNWATKNVPYGQEQTRLDAITKQLRNK